MQPAFTCLTSRCFTSNLTREHPMGQENCFVHRYLQSVVILSKVLLSFTLHQKNPPSPFKPTQNNRIQLGQAICSVSYFPVRWERMVLPRSTVNHLSDGEKPTPGWISFCSEQTFFARCNWKCLWSEWKKVCGVRRRQHTTCTRARPLALGRLLDIAGPQVPLHKQGSTSPGHWGVA